MSSTTVATRPGGVEKVDAQPTREVIQQWRSRGYSTAAIAAGTGLHHSTVGSLSRRGQANCSVETARAVAELTATKIYSSSPGHRNVPVGDLRDDIEGLLKGGWSTSAIAARSGLPWQTVRALLREGRVNCKVRTALPLREALDSMMAGEIPEAGTVPASAAQEHVASLAGAGFPLSLISAASGVAQPTVSRVVNGVTTRCIASTAHALLRVSHVALFDAARGKAMVPSYATRRRYEGMHYAGWTMADIDKVGARLGLHPLARTIERTGNGRTRGAFVSAATHHALAKVQRHVGSSRGPSARARTMARSLDFLPLDAWQDIDDPFEEALPAWAQMESAA